MEHGGKLFVEHLFHLYCHHHHQQSYRINNNKEEYLVETAVL